jgi:WD40 repeat protein
MYTKKIIDLIVLLTFVLFTSLNCTKQKGIYPKVTESQAVKESKTLAPSDSRNSIINDSALRNVSNQDEGRADFKLLNKWKALSNGILNATLSHNGEYCFASEFDSTISVWSVMDGSFQKKTGPLGARAGCISILPGDSLLILGVDSSIYLWNINSNTNMQVLGNHKSRITHSEISDNGERLLTSDELSIKLWDVKSHSLEHTFPFYLGGYTYFKPIWDKNYLLAITGNQLVVRLHFDSDQRDTLMHDFIVSEGTAAVISNDENKMFVTGGNSGAFANIYNIKNSEKICSFQPEKETFIHWACEFGNYNEILAIGTVPESEVTLLVISMSDCQILKEADGDDIALGPISVSKDKTKFAIAGNDNWIYIWGISQDEK